MKKIKKIHVLMLILVVAFILIALFVKLNLTQNLDMIVYNFFNRFENDTLTYIMKIITNLASVATAFFLSIVGLIYLKENKLRIIYILNLLVILLINTLLKEVFMRSRPQLNQLVSVSGYSFPSGHSMMAVGFYGFLVYQVYVSTYKKVTKIILMTCLFVLIILIGISRIYLGVHYFTDVLAGYIISTIYLYFFIKGWNKLKKYN